MMPRKVSHTNLIQLRPRPELVSLSRGRTVFVSRIDGRVEKERALEGLYVYNTRVLSTYEWLMNGKMPAFSCGSSIDQSFWMGYYIQTPENCRETPTHECDPLQETVELRISRSVGEGMHEDIDLTNHTQVATSLELALGFEQPFASRDEANGNRKQNGETNSDWLEPEPGVWEYNTDYYARHRYDHQGNKGLAAIHRGMKLRIENATTPPEHDQRRVTFRVALPPHGHWHACISWLAYVDGQLLPLATGCPLLPENDWDQRRTRFLISAADVTVGHGDNLASTVDRVLRRSRLDLADLRLYDLDSQDGIALAAGIPSYVDVFGRDMLATSWLSSMLGPELTRGSLNVLKKEQACEENDWRDAQPGRIVHEIHTDPLSVLNFRPEGLDFGSVSSSLLFPIAVSTLWHWTGDLDLVRGYADAAIRAIKWADTYSLDETHFYRYQTRSVQGVKNQGWKDSGDAIVYEDGSQVQAPIGTCEMQAFAYVAKLHFSELLWWLGETDLARRFYRESEELKSRFNDEFWMENEGYFGMAIGPEGELIRSVASDPGHCLLSGIVDDSRVKRVASRMLRDDLFSGWGVRTLSADHPAFNPFSYHRGSVWPVENAAFVLAFARCGLHGEMQQVAKAIFEAAALFQHDRLPELIGGHQRTSDAPFPGMYTKANWPQAWSASAPLAIVQALVGIYPYAPAKVLFVDPHLPEWLPEITVERVRVGNGSVSLNFFRQDGKSDFSIVDRKGTLRVVRQPSPWSVTSGWAERIRDAVMSVRSHKD